MPARKRTSPMTVVSENSTFIERDTDDRNPLTNIQGERQGSHVVEMQRRRLLLAIGEVVGEGGLEAANVGRVCGRAGVSRRTFYELFADREACLLAAFDQAIERIAHRLAPVYMDNELGSTMQIGSSRMDSKARKQTGWRERIRSALSLLLEQLEADPELARLCVVETLRAGPAVLERRRRVVEALAAVVDEGRAESRVGGEPPPLTAQGVVGGALSVIHARLLVNESSATDSSPMGRQWVDGSQRPLVDLIGPLMGMIVHPYLGPAAARAELQRPAPAVPRPAPRSGADPFKGLPIRFTYRTARVLSSIATDPGASNRHIADHSGIADEGQMSRLLARLRDNGLIENQGEGHTKGEPNAWTLTQRGEAIHTAIAVNA